MPIWNATRNKDLPAELKDFEEAVLSGNIVMTASVTALVHPGDVPIALSDVLRRHIALDEAHLCADDAEANRDALEHGDRVMTVYENVQLRGGKSIDRLWVITDAGWKDSPHRVTTILLPEDY